MILRQLKKRDLAQLKQLHNEVIDSLENKEFFMPFTEEEFSVLLNKNFSIFYGYFDKNKLVAISCLFLDKCEFEDVSNELGLNTSDVVKLGSCMVSPKYTGNNLMLSINKELIKLAKSLKYKYVVTTCHPENIASSKSLEKLGMINVKTIDINNEFLNKKYKRSLWLYNL